VKEFGQLLLVLWRGGAQGLVVLFCAAGLLALTPYVASQYGLRGEEPVASVEIWDTASGRIHREQVADLWTGEAPKEGRVPLWDVLLDTIRDHARATRDGAGAMRENTQAQRESILAMRSLAAELEDTSHMRPAARHQAAPEPRGDPSHSAWQQLVSWWQGT